MSHPRSLFEKLWASHEVASISEDVSLLHIDRVFLHERMGGVALKALRDAGYPVLHPELAFVTLDHIVDTRPERTSCTKVPGGEDFIKVTREESAASGLKLFDVGDPDHGIVHVISPELGTVLPGLTLVCPDSHTCTQGALGALAWGIGSSDGEHALATQTLRVARPKSLRVTFNGKLQAGVTAKDLMLALIARHTAVGAQGGVVEFCGKVVEAISVEERMTLCNMAVEFSAFSALIAPDQKVFDYLAGRPYAPRGAAWDAAVESWRFLKSDPGCHYDLELSLDCDQISPMVTWGTSPQHAVAVMDRVPDPETMAAGTSGASAQKALAYMGVAAGVPMEVIPIDAVFIGSCTNSRLSDLRAAARILQGRKVAPGLRAICVPGSARVKRAAEAEGLDKIFRAAGFEWREPGCSMCFYAGGEHMGEKARVISTTNRNFEGRQGPGTRTHLASPLTAAASALTGHICDPRRFLEGKDDEV